ncbi:hypothetical protein BZA70DRAFT_5646 [Myxozyma melibiosi]|uniref:Uncharacterized protein n=1 Tax=Myxozyma melibiosi TaxID=54550 RepID=A0ABR1FBC3_9ASCO
MVDHAANNSLPMADTMRSDAEPPMVAKPEPDSDSDLEKQAPAPSGKAFGAAATTTLPPPAPPASSNKKRVCGLSVFWFCCVVAAIIIVLAVALGAGLGAGLKKGNNNNKSSDSSSGSSSSSSLPVSSTTTISSTTSAISSSASASSTEASSSAGVELKVYVQTSTATVPVVTATATSIADAFCIPDSNIIHPALPKVKVTDDDDNAYNWRRYVEDRYNETRFYGSTWTDGSRGGCQMTAYTNEPLDDDSVKIGIYYRHGELELGKEYGVRITFLADILEGYDSSAGYLALDARVRLGKVNSTDSSDVQIVWKYTITQQEMIKKGYSTWTITLLDSFTVPDELDNDLPNSLELSIEVCLYSVCCILNVVLISFHR